MTFQFTRSHCWAAAWVACGRHVNAAGTPSGVAQFEKTWEEAKEQTKGFAKLGKRTSQNFEAMIYGELEHPSHPEHKLKLEHEATPYTCNGCHEIGFYGRYKCDEPFSSCNFHLHKDCASPEPTITHPFFPRCIFLFLQSPDHPGNYCDACGRDIKGYNYHCFEKDLDLHPSCATLLNTIVEGDLTLNLNRKVSSKCYKCGKKELQKKRKSWSYVSPCKECHLHVACVKDMLLENWEKECLGHGDGEKVEMEVTDANALVKKAPKLEIVLDKGRKRSKSTRFAKYKKIATMVITFIMAAVVGDPTALVIGLISSLIAH